jgi:hypothetical protein
MKGVFGQLREQIQGHEGRGWAGSVDDLLFDGERVRRSVSLGDNRVVVTSHRLLAFTPGRSGENYRQVDVPNVTDVRAGNEGESILVFQAARMYLYGGVLLAVGLFVDFGAFVPTDVFGDAGGATGKLGLEGLFGLMQQFLALIAQLDAFARLVGALLVLFGVFITAVYMLTRDRVLVVALAGDNPNITVPADDEGDVEDAVTALESVLFDPSAEGATEPTAPDTGFKSDDPL